MVKSIINLEIRSICSLIGVQGLQFFDEKMTRMVALLLSQMRQAIQQNQPVFEKMRGSDEASIRELGKRIGNSVLNFRFYWTILPCDKCWSNTVI